MVSYSSGQRGRIVNPLTTSSKVRILHSPPCNHYAGVAQWLEFLPSKQAVEGSNPFARSTWYIDLGADVNTIFTQLHIT